MAEKKIGVIDYEAGNLKSVETALKFLGADFFISKDPAEIARGDKVIFPGVGDAGASMEVLKRTGLGEAIKEAFHADKPVLGICLGTQIIFESSEERNTQCLGIVPGNVVKFPVKAGFKIPHMGWNQVRYTKEHFIFKHIPDNSSFYFVHSYYPHPADKEYEIAETDYVIPFTSAITYKNLVATQFHPEKSGERGLQLLKNFIEW